MTSIEIKDVNVAVAFCKMVARKGALSGSAFWSNDQWLARVRCYLDGMPTADAARVLASLRPKAKAYSITGATCFRCGCALSAPESVALGLGPECMARGV